MQRSLERIRFAELPRVVRILRGDDESIEPLIQEREKAAYDRGFRDGERTLSAQLVDQRAQLLDVQNGVLASLRAAIPQVIEESERALVTLAFELAQKIVAELPISSEIIAAMVRQALAGIEESSRCMVLLHPDDLALLQELDGAPFTTASGERIQFESSSAVSRGGCLVKTQFGTVDALRETKIALLRQALESP